jgi:hypothetical protein
MAARGPLARRFGMLVALLGITPAVLAAQSNLESVLSYRTVKVADGIYAFITPEERSGFQSGNSVAIIGDDGVLVYDTGNTPSSTRRQIAELRKLTDRPEVLTARPFASDMASTTASRSSSVVGR